MEREKRAREDIKENNAGFFFNRDPEPVIVLALEAFDKYAKTQQESEKEYKCQVHCVNYDGNKELLIEVIRETEQETRQTAKEMLSEWIREWYSKCQVPPPGLGWFVFPD